jgi:excisionase family DNA binding protein
MPEDWLTLEDAAAYLKVSKPTIYRFCAEGCLPFYKLAGTGQRRFKYADLDALLVPGHPTEVQAEMAEGAAPPDTDKRTSTTRPNGTLRRLD